MFDAALFASTVLIWGTTWIAIAFQVGPVPVPVSVFYRFALAALVLVALLAATGRLRLPERRHQPFLIAQALCLFSLNFLCFYTAAQSVPSGLISVIFSLATILNAVNARILFGDRITGRTILAAALGAGGLVLLFAEDLLLSFDAQVLKGMGLAVLGTLFFSLGNMVSRRNSAAGLGPLAANAYAMSYGALLLLALIALTGTPIVAPPDTRYLGALLYLAVIGSVVGFTAYLTLVARLGSARAAYATVLFPVVALTLSSLFEDYHWTPPAFAGLALTLVGNAVIFSAPRPKPAAARSAGAARP